MIDKHIKEVKEKYGETNEYKEYSKKVKDYSKDKWNNITKDLEEILKEFSIALKSKLSVTSLEVQKMVEVLQNHITNFFYTCSNEILLSLGSMYVNDERFKNNIDKYGIGTAKYINEAIKVYCLQ